MATYVMMLNVETRSAGVLCVCSTVYSSTCAHVYTCVVHECMNVTVFVCTHILVLHSCTTCMYVMCACVYTRYTPILHTCSTHVHINVCMYYMYVLNHMRHEYLQPSTYLFTRYTLHFTLTLYTTAQGTWMVVGTACSIHTPHLLRPIVLCFSASTTIFLLLLNPFRSLV